LDIFKSGLCDILIASSPVSTGIDGLQKICNNLVVIVPPWTSAELKQLTRRIERQGSFSKIVNIFYVEVEIETDYDLPWSWDRHRYNIVNYKKTLTDLVMDGIVPGDKLPSPEKVLEKAKKSLKEWIERLEDGREVTGRREIINSRFENFLEEGNNRPILGRRTLGDFSEMNMQWSRKKSSTLHKELLDNPEKWHEYHSLYRERRKTWDDIPYETIASFIIRRPDWVIGDFGCGDNLMKEYLNGNKVHSFDHHAIDESVTVCDISKVPLSDNSLDAAVYSLSLMGTNYEDYLREGLRVLKPFQKIFICEPINSTKWGDDIAEGIKDKLQDIGFKNPIVEKRSERFIYISAEK